MPPPTPQATESPVVEYRLPDGRTISVVALVKMLLRLKPTRIPDVATTDAVFGAARFKSLGEVSAAFEVHPTTVRKDWRSMGMPGEEGNWPVAELFRWRIERLLLSAEN